MKKPAKTADFIALMRLNRPIGIYLVLWPTLWGLWLAAGGIPKLDVLFIFIFGVILMRSAGCVINDIADRKIDGHVQRTRNRPLATGAVSTGEAIFLFILLVAISFLLVLLTNRLTIQLSLGAIALACIYPFMKRYTHLPQVVLGAAFAWSVPMAFAAQSGEINSSAWLVYTAVVLWTVAYDTFYAMVDREDDLKIGVKSTAVLLGDMDKPMTASLQFLVIFTMALVGEHFELGRVYQISLLFAGALFIYQQYLIRQREPKACFKAFLNNHWVGMIIFLGIVVDYAIK